MNACPFSMARIASSALAVSMLVLGCKTSTKRDTPPDPDTRVTPGQGSARDAKPAPRVALTDADVRTLIAAWVAAQNAGDFTAYEKMYAAKLEGVKRARARTWRFDRDGWMKDRKRMFAHPMTVAARDLTVRVQAAAAIVELTQTFAQGSFQDEGTKRMVVVLENGAARIAREEMLQSRSATPIGATDGDVFLVTNSGASIYLQDKVDPTWGAGPKTLLDGDVVFATQAIGNAPAEVKAWRGKSIDTYAADGTRCPATVSAPYLQGGETPHFGTRAEWRGDAGSPAFTDDQIADEVFDHHQVHLLADLTTEVTCTPVVAIAKGSPVFFPPTPDSVLAEKAVRAFRKLDDYLAIQREYKTSGGDGSWAASPDVKVFGVADGTRYVSVSHSEGAGCGEFEGTLWAMWSVTPAGKLARLDVGSSGTWDPIAVFDSDGDGQIEIVGMASYSTRMGTYETYFTSSDGTLTATQQVTYPFSDCSC